jgi:hypothetical protein
LTTHSFERSHDNHPQEFGGFCYLGGRQHDAQERIASVKLSLHCKKERRQISRNQLICVATSSKELDYTLVASLVCGLDRNGGHDGSNC